MSVFRCLFLLFLIFLQNSYIWGNRLTSVSGSVSYLTAAHDANGNMTRLGCDILSWNIRGQLASITSGGQTSTFGYDVYNRRISKSVSGGSARSYKWSGWSGRGGNGNGLFAKTNGLDDHTSLGGNAVITNHIGSIVALLNNAGQVAQLKSYDPFGKVNSSQNLNSFGGQSYGFTGLEHDESGLVYARNRYYSPALGRFISEDPIGFGGGANFYAYCGNDPINFTDPLGLSPQDSLLAFGGAVYGAADMASFGMLSDPSLLVPGVRPYKMFMGGLALANYAYRCGPEKAAGVVWGGFLDSMNFLDEEDPFKFGQKMMTAGLTALAAAEGAATAGSKLAGKIGTGGGCFVAGTAVTLGNGQHVAIETVKKGDTLLARDVDSGKVEARVVKRTSKVTSYELVTIEVADAVSGKVVDTITGTPNHPFYVRGKGWVPLGQLGIGTSLVTRAGPNSSTGSALVVKSVRRESHPEGVSVYNFEVDEFHTYFIGTVQSGIWVHNGPPCPGSSAQFGKKFGGHREDYPGVTHQEYRKMADDMYGNPNLPRYTYPAENTRFPGETHIIDGENLLRLDSEGNFKSLYPGGVTTYPLGFPPK